MSTTTINFDSGYTTGALDGQDGWTTSSSTLSVGTTYYSSPYALNHGGAGSWNSANRDMPSTVGLTLSFRIQWSSLHVDPFRGGSVYIRETVSSSVAFQIGAYSTSQAAFLGTTSETIGSITTGTWYLIELEVRSSDKYGRGRLNGGTWSSWIAPAASFSVLASMGTNCLANAYQVDDIVWTTVASGPANLKSYNTNLAANIKSINTNLIANVKSLDTNV